MWRENKSLLFGQYRRKSCSNVFHGKYVMEDEMELEAKLHNWSMENEINSDAQLQYVPDKNQGGSNETTHGGELHPESTTQYLELSDDEDSALVRSVGGIDTLGLEDLDSGSDYDGDGSITNDLERNPWDGLPYSSLYYDLLSKRKGLAVWKAKDDFVLSLDESQIILVTGHSGSGKSTQVPQWCAHFAKETGFESGTVVCTQPHALAAASLTVQVSREMDLTSIGNEVGYKIPFYDVTTEDTFLKFCTDKELLREMAEDPFLERYGIVIVDEGQERTVSTNILLSLLKVVCFHRDNIKLVVICLPHEMPKLEEYFDGVPIVDLKFMEENTKSDDQSLSPRSRQLEPTTKHHFKRFNSLHDDYITDAVETIIKCHCDQSTDGNMLVFMPHRKDIHEVCERVAREVAMRVLRGEAGDLVAIPLHKYLPCGSQQAVYENSATPVALTESGLRSRRVIVSDDIAESSFSLDNIAVVIDSGRCRTNAYNCRIRARSDFLAYITKLSSDLRNKRCKNGGHIYHLYTKSELQKFNESLPPAVARTELSTDVLLMKRLLQSLDVRFSSCQTLDPPAPEAYMQALEDLDYHGALNENGDLSDLGAVMSEFPLSLPLTKSVIASCGEQCTEEMITIAAMLVVPNCFLSQENTDSVALSSRRKTGHPAGDHFTLLNVYDAFDTSKQSEHWCSDNNLRYDSLKLASKVRTELVSVMKRLELPMSPRMTDEKQMEASIKKALLAGYFMQIAKDVDGSGNYLIVRDRHVSRLSSATSLKGYPEWVLFNDFVLSDKNCILTVSSVTQEMIAEITPSSYLANLPNGEAKDALLTAMQKLKEGPKVGDTNDIRTIASETESLNSQCGPSASSKTQEKSDRLLKLSSEKRDCGQKEKSDEIRKQSRGDRHQSTQPETDIFTQTARDLSNAYRQASDYVRNYALEEDEQSEDGCILQ